MLALILATAVLGTTAALAAFLFRLSLPATALAAYVLATAEVVLLAEALSLVHAVRAWALLAAQAGILAAVAALWIRRGRPLPPRPRGTARALLQHPVLLLLGVTVAAALAYEAFIAVATPPANWDSFTYHLSRVAAWYQRGAVEHHPAVVDRENLMPPNAEIQILYTVVFLGRDTLAALPQFLAQLALLVGVFTAARRLGFERAAAGFAALLLATLSEFALQSVTTQNDLVAAAAIVAAAAFVLGGSRRELALAGLAVGLAVGTKVTAVLAVPLLVLLALSRLPRRRLAELLVAAVVGFALVGAYGYAANLADGGSVIGRSEEISLFEPERTVRGTISTTARILWDFVDLSGWDADPRLLETLRDAGAAIFSALDIDWGPPEATYTPFFMTPNTRAYEDLSYFGPLGALLLLPLAAGFVAAGMLRRVPAAWLVLAAAVPLFAVEVALAHRYNLWIGRFMTIPVALMAPLAAWVYRWRLVSFAAAATGALFLSLVLAHNVVKPTPLSGRAVWSLDRIDAQTLAAGDLRPSLRALKRHVPAAASIGYSLHGETPIYFLYGDRLERRLVPLPESDVLRVAEEQGLRWVVTDREPRRARKWRVLSAADGTGWTLYARA